MAQRHPLVLLQLQLMLLLLQLDSSWGTLQACPLLQQHRLARQRWCHLIMQHTCWQQRVAWPLSSALCVPLKPGHQGGCQLHQMLLAATGQAPVPAAALVGAAWPGSQWRYSRLQHCRLGAAAALQQAGCCRRLVTGKGLQGYQQPQELQERGCGC